MMSTDKEKAEQLILDAMQDGTEFKYLEIVDTLFLIFYKKYWEEIHPILDSLTSKGLIEYNDLTKKWKLKK